MTSLSRFFAGVLLFVFAFLVQVQAQNDRASLEKEKAAAQNQIKEIEQILNQTASKRKASVGQLSAINKQIESRSKVIRTITGELQLLNEQITEDNVVIQALEEDLENLKKEYAVMVYAAHKSSSGYNRLTFLFSSESFNQFLMRFKYLQQYSDARHNQVELITDVMDELIREKEQLEIRKVERQALLDDKVKEADKLKNLKNEQNKLLTDLKSREKELTKEISQKKRDLEKLEKLIADLIRTEMVKTPETKKEPAIEINLTNLTNSFEDNKAKLPWPVTTGFISEKFGTHPHPVYKRIKVPNDGVNIQTKQSEKVKAVFKGEVKKIAVVPGMKYVIIVQHGSYYTVYAGLKEVSVSTGQDINVNDVIGEVNTDKNGISEIQFQVWKNTTKLDPELWLAKR
jgi:septal ring factor EnvC (AmiA/AmiB activator)